MSQSDSLERLNSRIVECRLCPRLVEWREKVATEKRKAFKDCTYWARPLPIFGDSDANRLIVGLAPAAHGGNRTGRIFTGDRSGDWLFRALYKAGVASQSDSVSREDGMKVKGILITAIVLCAPPANRPSPEEIRTCRRYLGELLAGRDWTSMLCLGRLAWEGVFRTLGQNPVPKFSHGARHKVDEGPVLIGSFHPSQQNTFTGKLTEPMFDSVVRAFLTEG